MRQTRRQTRRQELAALGLRGPWAILVGIRIFVMSVWDPTRSDIQAGINYLMKGAMGRVTPETIRNVEELVPQLADLFAEGYDPSLEPGPLEQLPDGSLGREYARFLRRYEIDPLSTLLKMKSPTNVIEYTARRAYKMHDLIHVVLGCDASVMGEVQVVSYSLGQTKTHPGRAQSIALAVLFLHLALRRPLDLKRAIARANEFMVLGLAGQNHVAFRLEDYLDRPIAEVRELMLAA